MSQQINIIAAVDDGGGIGKDGGLPWPKLPKDMERFKSLTGDGIVIMGYKTFLSLGKPLKNRTNIVLSRTKNEVNGASVFPTLKEALTWCGERSVWLIGGVEVYREGLGVATDVYFTRVPGRFRCDVYFPFINKSFWEEIKEETTTVQDGEYNLKFQHYKKR